MYSSDIIKWLVRYNIEYDISIEYTHVVFNILEFKDIRIIHSDNNFTFTAISINELKFDDVYTEEDLDMIILPYIRARRLTDITS